MDDSLRVYFLCNGQSPVPIERLPGNQRGHVGNPQQTRPKMFRTVYANQDEFVLQREGGNVAPIDGDECASLEQLFDLQRARIVSKCPLRMEFNEKVCAGLTKSVFAGGFPGINGRKRDTRLVRKLQHGLR